MALKAAYIVPHPPLAVAAVGRGEERKISGTLQAYREVARRIAAHKPSTIIYISPHSAYYGDWIYIGAGESARGDFAMFGAPQEEFCLTYNTCLRDEIIAEAKGQGLPAGFVTDAARELDHGLMVPLHFIGQELPSSAYQAVSVGGSGLPDADLVAFGRCIAHAVADHPDDAILLASGDLSHKLTADGPYGFDPAGPVFDGMFGEIVRSGDLLRFAAIDPHIREDAAECGLSGFIMLAGALDEAALQDGSGFASELLSLEGPFGVGYGVAAFERS